MYAKWVQSWRDLPILINQWANVVRWEKVTRLFLRTTEFLWQEGHTAHETAEEAEEETRKMLAVYKDFAESELAMPVMDGQKTESEKFAGADRTYSIEALMRDGRALQAGTSHNLGQNFSKSYEIKFQARDKSVQYAWTTSWGVSTAMVGAVIMAHGDDGGLILPPASAPYQVVHRADSTRQLEGDRVADGAGHTAMSSRARYPRENRRPANRKPGDGNQRGGMRGVPLRLAIGPEGHREVQVELAPTRYANEVIRADGRVGCSRRADADGHSGSTYDRALTFRTEHTSETDSYDEFKQIMEGRHWLVVSPCAGRRSAKPISRTRRRRRFATFRSRQRRRWEKSV
jgi:prolyl-tRNA synthetase